MLLSHARKRERQNGCLSELGYWTGAIDGVFDPATRFALIAFQKWEGRSVTGKLTIARLKRCAVRHLRQSKRRHGYEHVEVDIDRQVLIV